MAKLKRALMNSRNLRQRVFWLRDRIGGEKLHDFLEDVRRINTEPFSSVSVSQKNAYLNKLLEKAVASTDFYRPYTDFSSLKDFPVINKGLIRENPAAFQSSLFVKEQLKYISTSGSTGVPFSIGQNAEKVLRNQADNLYYAGLSGYEMGLPLYYLRIWNEVNRKSALYHFVQNTIPFNITNLSDESMKSLVAVLQKLRKKASILAYGSTYEVLASYIQRKKISFTTRPIVALVMSEPLHQNTRIYLSEALGCNIFSRYSNAECGFMGHQWRMDSGEYLMNTASYHVELLDFDSDNEVEEGKPGRVVVTDLFNYSTPLIRYDTGDIAVKGHTLFEGVEAPVFRSIEGRKLDFISNIRGELVSPHTVDYALRSLPKLVQFQLIQNEVGKYQLNLQLKERFEGVENMVLDRLNEYLGPDAEIDINFVEEIPILNSGKRKIVINNMNNRK